MARPLSRRALLAGGASGLMASLAGCTGMTPFVGQRLTAEHVFGTDDVRRLAVRGDVGTIDIRGENRDDIHVDVEKQSSSVRTDLEELTVDPTVAEDTLTIDVEFTGEVGWMESRPTANLDIRVPEGFELTEVESSVGRTTLERVSGDLDVEATTGRVTVRNVDGSVDARSTTGRIDVRDVTGGVTARTTTGRIEVESVGWVGDLNTSTGRIETDIPAIQDSVRIGTNTGRIEAAIDPTLDIDIDATTSTGRITHDELPIEASRSERTILQGVQNNGGPTVRLDTNTGRIELVAL